MNQGVWGLFYAFFFFRRKGLRRASILLTSERPRAIPVLIKIGRAKSNSSKISGAYLTIEEGNILDNKVLDTRLPATRPLLLPPHLRDDLSLRNALKSH